jgi:hypothetical protein
MTNYKPVFNVDQFEDRNFTASYFSDLQLEAITEVQDRVNDQLDWLAQLLGWNGDNYWSNLASSVSQKRRLQVGSFGVYDKFHYPKVVAIRNWDSQEEFINPVRAQVSALQSANYLWVVIERDDKIQEGQTLVIGDYNYVIDNLATEGETFVIRLSGDVNKALENYQGGEQVKIRIEEILPAPFYRPNVDTAGDDEFSCLANGTELQLFPLFNSSKTLPVRMSNLFVGSTYYFDKPVYFSRTPSRVVDSVVVQYPVDVSPLYNADRNLWMLSIPEDFTVRESGEVGFLVWLYSDSSTETFCVKEVNLNRWANPSDWNIPDVADYYLGTWGNKGGPLPFNFVFDSLEVSGFDERKSMMLDPVENRVSFDTLLNFVYYQRTPIDVTAPGSPEENQVWWDNSTGSFSVWKSSPYGCGTWDQIMYPHPPEVYDTPQFVYPDVDDFEFSQSTVPPGVLVEIVDISGLGISNNILGLLGTLTSPGSLRLYKNDDDYWVPFEFSYSDELDFDGDALKLPWYVPVIVQDATGIGSPGRDYIVENLSIVIDQPLPVKLLKDNNNTSWYIEPVSSLKYIGNTRLFGSSPDPLQGSMNWNYDLPDEEERRAAIYYYSDYVETSPGNWELVGAWVDVNTGEAVDPPSANLDFGTILVYCNDVLLEENVDAGFEDFNFLYEVDATTGEFVFKYNPITFSGTVNLPKIVISDSLTSVYRFDITEYVFSGVNYYMSPNVLDAETPLRLWKTQALQTAGDEHDYINPLVADENNGPGEENWQQYFVRLPPRYGRNSSVWQKVALTCQNFGYWGSPVSPVNTKCPPENQTPRIYEQVYLFREEPYWPTTLYSEPYLYSDVVFGENFPEDDFSNAGILPTTDTPFDEFSEGSLSIYEPLHNRRANTSLPVGEGYGNWEGAYLQAVECSSLSGFVTTDLLSGVIHPIEPPIWDYSMYKLPTSCAVNEDSYKVDLNNFKIGYAYFTADLSCAEDGFFDIHQEAAWRVPATRERTLYVLPKGVNSN